MMKDGKEGLFTLSVVRTTLSGQKDFVRLRISHSKTLDPIVDVDIVVGELTQAVLGAAHRPCEFNVYGEGEK